jgi:hypothetical protein
MLAMRWYQRDDYHMSEVVKIPGVLGVSSEIEDAVIGELVSRQLLPSDFYFRLLSVEPDTRESIAGKDVLKALGYGEGSGNNYLTQDLPDCTFVPGPAPIKPILEQLEDDYHRLYDLRNVTDQLGLEQHIALQSWAMYTKALNPGLFDRLHLPSDVYYRSEAGNSRRYQYKFMLGRVVIKDSALLDIYNGNREVVGHGPVRQRLLHYLLLDNHPDLGLA